MRPEERLKAIAEVLEEIASSPAPAHDVINAYTRSRRYMGAGDRRFITENAWAYLRHRARLAFLYPQASVAERLEKLPAGIPACIPNAPDWVNWETPEWLAPLIPNAARELPALLDPAPTVLRAVGDRSRAQALLKRAGIETHPTRLSPHGLVLEKRANLAASPCYRQGLIEIQDEGSQLVVLELGILPNARVLDICAGAGGKSLMIAALRGNQGELIAFDISPARLKELEKRAARSRARIRTITSLDTLAAGSFDHVLADAPCSGTGTGRRAPDARWKLTPQKLDEYVGAQASILATAANFVRPGGVLSYITCSLTECENQAQTAAFLAAHPDFSLVKERLFTPATTQTDGFYVALMKRTAD